MRPLDQLAEIAQKAVRIGSNRIKTSRPQTVTEKTDRDVYTDVDVQIEREIRGFLAELTPDIQFHGEEEGASQQVASDHKWVLDPIDGTANFVHRVPMAGVSLALIRGNRPVIGAISLPFLELHYVAIKERGAYLNGHKIKASRTAKLSESMIAIGDYAVGDDSIEKNRDRIAMTAALVNKVERIRMFGSAAHDLAWLAEGRIDAALILSNQTIDIAAGVLIAREAGAVVLDSSGREHDSDSKNTIACAPNIADSIVAIVHEAIGRPPLQASSEENL